MAGAANVNQAAAGALQTAGQGFQQGMNFQPGTIQGATYKPAQQRTFTLARQNMGQYMNPYTEQVIQRGQQDIARQQQQALNTLGANAPRGAFGGDRYGLAEAQTAAEFGRQALDFGAQQRQQAYQQALGAAQFDVGQRAATEAANVGARTAASQFGAQAGMTAQQQNIANQMAANQARLGAAGQLAGLGGQAFNIGQTIQQQQSQQGLLQQGLQQALIDAAKGQFAGYAGSPMASLSAPLAALGAAPNVSTQTTSQSPGLFNYLQMAAGLSDARLKKNIEKVDNVGGVNFYTWDWNEIGEKIAPKDQPKFGVIADELQETHPHLVECHADGYLRVNYKDLMSELGIAA